MEFTVLVLNGHRVTYLSENNITYNDTKSLIETVRFRVHRGSIFSPLLFLIYINGPVSVCLHTMPFPFVHDTNLFINGDDLL